MEREKQILCHAELLRMIQCLKFYKRDNLLSKCLEAKQAYQDCIFNELKQNNNSFTKSN